MQPEDEHWKRSGVANALFACVEIMTTDTIVLDLFKFLIDRDALGDPNGSVQQRMLNVGK
jgi:hypothetical protein